MIYKLFWFFRALIYKALFKKIGFPSYIGKPLFITGYSCIEFGKKTRVFPHVRIEVTPQAKLIVKDNVAIAQNVHITCGKSIKINTGSCIAANVCITDTRHNYSDLSCNVLEQPDSYYETIIGENCFVGFGAVIDAGSKLGNHCIVAANAYVRGEFPDNCVIAGSPAKVIKKI